MIIGYQSEDKLVYHYFPLDKKARIVRLHPVICWLKKMWLTINDQRLKCYCHELFDIFYIALVRYSNVYEYFDV